MIKNLLLFATMSALICSAGLPASAQHRHPVPAAEAKPSLAQEPKASSQASPQSTESPAQKYFGDVELLNQDGAKLRFYSDLLKGRTVVIIPFFSTCTNICPPMNRTMEKIQDALGDRLGTRAFLISISVDPQTDKPERLKAHAAKFHAKPGWSSITGNKENVDWALHKLGQYVADKNDHSSIMIIGNEATGLWKKAFALAQAGELLKIIDDVANDKGDASAQ